MTPLFLISLSVVLIFFAYVLARHHPASYSRDTPPGPPKLPFVGSLLSIPKGEDLWKTYYKWSKEYGSDIIRVDLLGSTFIILHSYQSAVDLLEKRSSIYSSRMSMPMVNELMGWGFSTGFMRYGEKWRTHRRIGNQVLGPPAVKEIQPLVGKAVRQLLTQLLEKPNDFLHHARYMTGDIIMKMIYGIEVLPAEDPYIMAAQDILEKMTVASIPGTYWVDFMPILKYIPDWLPGASFKRRAKEWKAAVSKTVDTPFQVAKNSIANGTNLPSLTSSNLADIDYSEKNALQEEEDLKNVAGTLYVVGADSTTSSMSTFFLAMMTNPEAQAQAQAELDRVLGPGKLPTMEDEVLLPFVTAVVKEVLRWKTVSPIGNPHALEADDIYQGYKLSAGTIVVTNIWAMLHDKELYPEPYTFNPERFIKNGHWNPSVVDPTDITFGFGRRICSGKYLAYSTLWISIASVLTMFNITKAMDEDGHTIEPSGEYTSGTFCKPVPFKCCIKPRSKRHAQECQ